MGRFIWDGSQFHFWICGFELSEGVQWEILDSEERSRLKVIMIQVAIETRGKAERSQGERAG